MYTSNDTLVRTELQSVAVPSMIFVRGFLISVVFALSLYMSECAAINLRTENRCANDLLSNIMTVN